MLLARFCFLDWAEWRA